MGVVHGLCWVMFPLLGMCIDVICKCILNEVMALYFIIIVHFTMFIYLPFHACVCLPMLRMCLHVLEREEKDFLLFHSLTYYSNVILLWTYIDWIWKFHWIILMYKDGPLRSVIKLSNHCICWGLNMTIMIDCSEAWKDGGDCSFLGIFWCLLFRSWR